MTLTLYDHEKHPPSSEKRDWVSQNRRYLYTKSKQEEEDADDDKEGEKQDEDEQQAQDEDVGDVDERDDAASWFRFFSLSLH